MSAVRVLPVAVILGLLFAFFNVVLARETELDTAQSDNPRCNYTDPMEFFQDAHDYGWNITEVVTECQNLCILSYGTGNPDLDGIGVSRTHTMSQ